MTTAEKLTEMKSQIEETKTEIARLTGAQDQLKKDLKEKFKCDTIAQAEAKIDTVEKEIEALELEIEEGIQEVTKKYGLEV